MNQLILSCMVLCIMAGQVSTTLAAEPGTWEKAISEFEAADAVESPPDGVVVFVGSSSIRMWSTLEADMSPVPVINRGFGGSEIEDSIRHFDRIVSSYKPSAVVFYAGDNDIAKGKSPQQVYDDFKAFVTKFKASLPDISLFYIAIKPSPRRWSLWPQMQAANEMIEKYAASQDNVYFFDVATPMLTPDGNPREELFIDDMLHMNDAGYRLWTSIVKPALLVNLNRK